jgi:2-keto-3-deoxy-6-phosphogluconate aldolase
MPRHHARLLALALIRAGFTVREVAERLRAHPKAIAELMAALESVPRGTSG